jgi:hypothetical protein
MSEPQEEKAGLAQGAAAGEPVRDQLLALELMPTEWEKRLFKKPWLPLAMLVPIGGLFLIGLAEDFYSYSRFFRGRGISFQLLSAYLSLDVIYVSFALLSLVLVWLFQRFARQAPGALYALWENGALSAADGAGDDDWDTRALKYLTRYRQALAGRGRLLFVGAVLLVTNTMLIGHVRGFGLSLETFPDVTWTTFLVFKWVVFPNLWLWIILTACWAALTTAYFLRRLPQELDLRVIPSHPDRCGGLKPVGDLCLQLALVAVIASLVLAYWGSIGGALRTAGLLPELSDEAVARAAEEFLPKTLAQFRYLFNPTRPPQSITQTFANLGTAAGIIIGGWLFLYPLLGIHGCMKGKRAELAHAMAQTALAFDEELEEAIRAQDRGRIREAHDNLETLQSTYSVLRDYPVWPIQRASFFLRFVTPELLTIAGLILNIDLDLASAVLQWIGQ